MNKTLTTLLLALTAMLAVSCSDDDTPDVPRITDIKFTAQMPSLNTDLYDPQWRVLEGMRFFSSDGPDTQAYYMHRSDAPVKVAEFRYDRGGDIALWDKFAAFHGYGYGTLDNFEAKVNSSQKFIPGSTDAEEDMLISPVYNAGDIDFSQPVNIELRRVGAVLNLNVADITSEGILKGDTLIAVKLDTKNNETNFAGSLIINFYDGTVSRAAASTYKEAVAANDGIAFGDDDKKLLLSILPVNLAAGDKIEVTIKTKAGRTARKTMVLDGGLKIGEGMCGMLKVEFTDEDF